MKTELTKKDNELIVNVEGNLDTKTAPILDEELKAIDDDIETVTFDFKDLDYISSSGLRILVKVLKIPGPVKRKVRVLNAKDFVLEILTATGLDEIIDIQQTN